MKVYLVNNLNFNQFKVLLLFFAFFFIQGCLAVKPATTKSGKKYFESFYVGEDGNQYFIKPLLLIDDESKENLFVDFTFRYRNEIKDSAIVNFSIHSSMIYKSIDSLKISNETIEINSNNIVIIFNEKNNKEFISRFTTKIPLDQIKSIFNSNDWHFIIYDQTSIQRYKPHRKTEKVINSIRDRVFILM